MTDIQLAHRSFGGEARDRNREHIVAIREARIATEYRIAAVDDELWARVAPAPSFMARLRLAVAGGPAITADPCNCPA